MKGYHGNYGPSFTVIGTSVVLSPNTEHFSHLSNMLAEYDESKSFGFEKCNSGIDEQVLAYFYSYFLSEIMKQNFSWTYVSQQVNGFLGTFHGYERMNSHQRLSIILDKNSGKLNSMIGWT